MIAKTWSGILPVQILTTVFLIFSAVAFSTSALFRILDLVSWRTHWLPTTCSYIVYVVPTYLLVRIVHDATYPHTYYRCRPAGGSGRGRWAGARGRAGRGYDCNALNAKFSMHFLPDFCILSDGGRVSAKKSGPKKKSSNRQWIW